MRWLMVYVLGEGHSWIVLVGNVDLDGDVGDWKRINLMDWNDKVTVKKGNLAEELVDNHIESMGYIPYHPKKCDKPHPFDRLCASPDKKYIYIAESKGKARRTYYPDSGIDIKNYEEYCYIENNFNIQTYIYFVDEDNKKIYGNFLYQLRMPRPILYNGKWLEYPIRQKGIIYFPIDSMEIICSINDEAANKLKRLSSRNYPYLREKG